MSASSARAASSAVLTTSHSESASRSRSVVVSTPGWASSHASCCRRKSRWADCRCRQAVSKARAESVSWVPPPPAPPGRGALHGRYTRRAPRRGHGAEPAGSPAGATADAAALAAHYGSVSVVTFAVATAARALGVRCEVFLPEVSTPTKRAALAALAGLPPGPVGATAAGGVIGFISGLVGAGGLGVALQASMDNLYWDQVGLVLLVIFAVVVVTEIVTATIRSRVI